MSAPHRQSTDGKSDRLKTKAPLECGHLPCQEGNERRAEAPGGSLGDTLHHAGQWPSLTHLASLASYFYPPHCKVNVCTLIRVLSSGSFESLAWRRLKLPQRSCTVKQNNPVAAAAAISLTDHTVSPDHVPWLASPGHEMSVEFVEWIVPLESPDPLEQRAHTFFVLYKSLQEMFLPPEQAQGPAALPAFSLHLCPPPPRTPVQPSPPPTWGVCFEDRRSPAPHSFGFFAPGAHQESPNLVITLANNCHHSWLGDPRFSIAGVTPRV